MPGERPHTFSVLPCVLFLGNLHEEEVIDVMVAVYSPVNRVLLKNLVSCPWAVHLQFSHVLYKRLRLVGTTVLRAWHTTIL